MIRFGTQAYDEEYYGLQGLEVYTKISTAKYLEFVRKHGDDAQAIPTMNLFIIKPDMKGDPTRVKSCILALGNLKKRIWSREDQYAPALSATASRLLTSMTVDNRRRLKQGDCKNVFCNGILPKDKTCIVKPPTGCPVQRMGYIGN